MRFHVIKNKVNFQCKMYCMNGNSYIFLFEMLMHQFSICYSHVACIISIHENYC